MIFLSLVFQNTLIVLFISTSFSKIFRFKEHIKAIELYKLPFQLPSSLILIFLLTIEIFIPLTLLSNLNYQFSSTILLIILLIYTITIFYQLKANETEIRCGCGGILNSENISISTLIRNLVLTLMSILLLIFPNPIESINENTPFLMLGILLALTYYLFTEYQIRNNEINTLQKEMF